MTIQTRDFGRMEIQEEDVITFVSPIYGFEGFTRFVCLFDENNTHMVWLQSLDDSGLCFILADPAVVDGKYHPHIPKDLDQLLGEGERLFWLIMVVAPDFRDSTVNMKSPVVINPASCRAVQAILEEDYPIRKPLVRERGDV